MIELIQAEASKELSNESRKFYEETFPPKEQHVSLQIVELLNNIAFNLVIISYGEKLYQILYEA